MNKSGYIIYIIDNIEFFKFKNTMYDSSNYSN